MIPFMQKADVIILRPHGAMMGGPETTEFQETINGLLSRRLNKFVIDLQQVRWMNAAGIGILVDTLNRVKETKGSVKLTNCCGRIGYVFSMLKLDTAFQHFNDLDAAVASFA